MGRILESNLSKNMQLNTWGWNKISSAVLLLHSYIGSCPNSCLLSSLVVKLKTENSLRLKHWISLNMKHVLKCDCSIRQFVNGENKDVCFWRFNPSFLIMFCFINSPYLSYFLSIGILTGWNESQHPIFLVCGPSFAFGPPFGLFYFTNALECHASADDSSTFMDLKNEFFRDMSGILAKTETCG